MSVKKPSEVTGHRSRVMAPVGHDGTILLMALLVMSGVLIVGASLGTISILSLRQARVTDDAIVAFAAAESGAEQTLYQIRRVGSSIAELNDDDSDADGEDSALTGETMRNASGWERQLSGDELALFTDIPENRSYEVVLWDPDDPDQPAGVDSLGFAWEDDCGGTSALEVLATGWDPAMTGPFAPEIAFHGSGPTFTFLKEDPQSVDDEFRVDRAYRVRLRAKNCDIFNLAVRAYSADGGAAGGGSAVPIPSRLSVNSQGTFRSARQGMEFRLPRLQPLTGVFDFIIFSQCSILKGVSGGVCP